MYVREMPGEVPECPLCLDFLEVDDINFFPCSCGYQICRFCWNRIRTVGNGLCPACRREFSEKPADFKPPSSEDVSSIKGRKKQKEPNKKVKMVQGKRKTPNSDTRVVQSNLVFVSGLPTRIADPEILKRPEYFGKFGKIHRIIINHAADTNHPPGSSQLPSATAYVTYLLEEDALAAIQAVTNTHMQGRILKATVGTTKYCSHFLKNKTCPKYDCMYLHQIADERSSFSKEDMKEGKHIEYARSLLKEMIKNSKSSRPPRCPTPPLTQTEQTSFNQSPVNDWFEEESYDKEVHGNDEEDVNDADSEADLDFDPFHETQKGLAELLEREAEAEAELSRRRPPPPPPGFEHLRSSYVRMGSSPQIPDEELAFNSSRGSEFSQETPGVFQPAQFYPDNYDPFSSPPRERHFSNGSEFWNLNSYRGMEEGRPHPMTAGRDWQDSLQNRNPERRKADPSWPVERHLLPAFSQLGLQDRFAQAVATTSRHQHWDNTGHCCTNPF